MLTAEESNNTYKDWLIPIFWYRQDSFANWLSRLRPRPFLAPRLSLQLVHLLKLRHVQVPPLAPLVFQYALQPRRNQHEG